MYILLQGMQERLVTMKEDIETSAQRCENLGSVENLDQSDLPANTPIYKLAATVNGALQQATDEVSVLYYPFLCLIVIMDWFSFAFEKVHNQF